MSVGGKRSEQFLLSDSLKDLPNLLVCYVAVFCIFQMPLMLHVFLEQSSDFRAFSIPRCESVSQKHLPGAFDRF